jgi:hypothetical protein
VLVKFELITEGIEVVKEIELVDAVVPVKLKLYVAAPLNPTVPQSTLATVLIDQEGPAS